MLGMKKIIRNFKFSIFLVLIQIKFILLIEVLVENRPRIMSYRTFFPSDVNMYSVKHASKNKTFSILFSSLANI